MEHYTRRTEYVLAFCGTCMRVTKHPVSGGRMGLCIEHGPKAKPSPKGDRQKKRPAPETLDLFAEVNDGNAD